MLPNVKASPNTGILPDVPSPRSAEFAAFDNEFAACLTALGLESQPSFITALSGGADSAALALLAQRYALKHRKQHKAVIIDHGLRKGSSAEAARVCRRFEALGLTCHVLRVVASRPKAALQEWARNHRLALLSDAARVEGAVVLFGHHSGDLAETVMMRLLRGSGLAGLAGIPARRQQGGVIFARPILNWPAAKSRAICAAFNCAYEQDPSNNDLGFERVRVRQMLAGGDCADDRCQRFSKNLLRLAGASGAITRAFDTAVAPTLQAAMTWQIAGFVDFDPAPLAGLPQACWWRVMRRVIQAVGGRPYGASDAAGIECRQRVMDGRAATVGGCHFHPHPASVSSSAESRKGRYTLFRETGRQTVRHPIQPHKPVIFAGCWQVLSPVEGVVHALADAPQREAGTAQMDMPESWRIFPHRARQAIPVVTGLDGMRFYPHLHKIKPDHSDGKAQAFHMGMAETQIYFADRQVR